jgi:hypothetical protein
MSYDCAGNSDAYTRTLFDNHLISNTAPNEHSYTPGSYIYCFARYSHADYTSSAVGF